MRLPALIFALACLLAGTGLGWLVASRTINWVEAAQTAELQQSMYAGGIVWAGITADGFAITLSGEAPDTNQQDRAINIATMIVGGDLVNRTTVAEPAVIAKEPIQPMVEIMRNGADISLIGRLPPGPGRRSLDTALASLDLGKPVIDISEIYADPLPDGWSSALDFGARILSQTNRAIITVTPGQVVVEAVAISANSQDGLNELLQNIRPKDVALLVTIIAPRPVIAPYQFSLDIANPTSAVCAAQSEAEAARIIQYVKPVALPEFTCQIGIGAPSLDWGQVVIDTLDTLFALQGGSLLIDGSDISIVAPLGTEKQMMDGVTQNLRAKLPDVYSLHTTLPASLQNPQENDLVMPAIFDISLSNEGFVTISGTLKDDLTRDVVIRYAESKFGYNLVEMNYSDQAELPEGWQKRVFAAVEVLALLESGTLLMTPETIAVAGIAAFEAPEDEIAKLLLAALGQDAQFELDLTYEPPKTEALNNLDPRICAARVTTILGDNQISFAPSSAVIEESSKPTIEAITAILANCRNAAFEIGGHTDSQGREEMNRALSQSRADAVLDAMLAQNLLIGTVTAVGYGEAEPIAGNETEEGRAANRRIVINLIRNSEQDHPEETTDEQN